MIVVDTSDFKGKPIPAEVANDHSRLWPLDCTEKQRRVGHWYGYREAVKVADYMNATGRFGCIDHLELVLSEGEAA